MIVIKESGLTFGKFDKDSVYRNEKSFNLPSHVKSVEFTLLNRSGSNLVFVEAKSSFSNPQSKLDFERNLQEVYLKFVDSITVFAAAKLGKHVEIKKELPHRLEKLQFKNCSIHIRLVIPDFKDSWLPPISDALRKKARHTLASFDIPLEHLQVINQRLAKKQGLIE